MVHTPFQPVDLNFTINVNNETLDFEFPRFACAHDEPLKRFFPYTVERMNGLPGSDREMFINAWNLQANPTVAIPTINHPQYQQPLLNCFNGQVEQQLTVNNEVVGIHYNTQLHGGYPLPFVDFIYSENDISDTEGYTPYAPLDMMNYVEDYLNGDDTEALAYYLSEEQLDSFISHGEVGEGDINQVEYVVTTTFSAGNHVCEQVLTFRPTLSQD